MFDRLSERLSSTFKKLSGGGLLSEVQVDEGLKEIRRSLLEADVHFKVARDICDRIREKAIGAKVWQNLSAGQQVVQIFHDELVSVLGGKDQLIPEFKGKPPVVLLLAGLQGSGKTTFSAKLSLYIKKKLRKSVGLIPADCARPAAKEQLKILGQKVDTPVFDSRLEDGAVLVVKQGLQWAESQFFDVVIIDTAGRQQVDEDLMDELSKVCQIANPQEKFLVLDSMIGSQGLDVAKTFHEKITLTGLCLSKLDGDSRGGVALSARAITGVPLVFAGVGEKVEDLEPFFPDRMAGRILGMGDVLTLVEKARETIDESSAMESVSRMMSGEFTVEDFKDHLKKLQNLGPLEGMLKLIPGLGGALKQAQAQGLDPDKEFKRIEALINSMTKEERRNVDVLNGSRRLRIAKGSGTSVAEINRFIKQFMETQKMMKKFSGKGMMKMLAQMQQFGKKGF